MINWWGVASNALWILGLALLLAAWSLAYYEAQRTGGRVRECFSRPGYGWALTVGIVLFCAGLAATEYRLWARVLWGMLGLAFLAERLFSRTQPSGSAVEGEGRASEG